MSNSELPENMLQLFDIADAVGLDDYKPLLDTFEAAKNRVLKCGNDAAHRLLVHSIAPEHLTAEQKQQLVLDARYIHHMVKAVNVRAWMQTTGAHLSYSKPEITPHVLSDAWKAINGEVYYDEQFDGKPAMHRWLKESFTEMSYPESRAVQELLDGAPSLEAR